MPDPLATINTRRTPQSEQADPRQVPNSAGGYAFVLDDLARLRRFLVLGTTGGTYYAGERELTRDNAQLVLDLARTRGLDVVTEAVAISQGGRAPKNDQALFAVAAVLAFGDGEAKRAAEAAVPLVARTGTHLFQLVGYAEQFRGWGKVLRRAIGGWYRDRDADSLAFQVAKYRERAGWTHRDVLRSAHPEPPSPLHSAVYDFACGRTDTSTGERPRILEGFLLAQRADTPAASARLIESYRLSWEMVRTEHLTSPVVWEALLGQGLPATALMRQLPRLTNLGLLGPGSRWTAKVAEALADTERLRKARVHPIAVLVALHTYAGGRSLKGKGTWSPVRQVVDALDAGFYAAFGAVEPTGKRRRVALDVSGSMGSMISGLPLSAREASAALAMVTVAAEPTVDVVGFTDGSSQSYGYGGWRHGALTPLDVSPRRRLDDNVRAVSGLAFGGTDVALPITDAQRRGLLFDSFEVYTDNESWAGPVHVHQALRDYRNHTGIDARLVVVGMTATEFTVADPNDPGSLNVAGFDTAAPNLIGDFIRGAV